MWPRSQRRRAAHAGSHAHSSKPLQAPTGEETYRSSIATGQALADGGDGTPERTDGYPALASPACRATRARHARSHGLRSPHAKNVVQTEGRHQRGRPGTTTGEQARIGFAIPSALFNLVPFAVVILLWQGLTMAGLGKPIASPSPLDVANAGLRLASTGEIWPHIIASTLRVLLGVVIGVILAIPAGFILGWFPSVRRFFDPLANFLRALPPIALVPLVVVYVGIGESGRLFVLIYASFFPATIVIYEGITSIEAIYIKAAQVLGANRRELFQYVLFPLSIPHILTAFRVALGVAWATLVAAELVAARTGLGAMIQNASNFFQIPTIFLGIILIGLVALTMDAGVRRLSARFVAWREGI
ncbi:MAG: ABC transporter permease [Trueperaceae bacterium]|nr:ABC transporter permease [Trueperaceae bacterium]